MAKPFDAATKQLVESDPEAWLRYLGLVVSSARPVDTDLSAVTAAADRVLRVESPAGPYIAHLEFQAGQEDDLAERLLHYNTLLRYRHKLPVQTVLILLRRAADDPKRLTGTLRYDTPHPDGFLHFGYRVVRVWQQDPDALLSGELALLPLAPVANVARRALPGVIRRMEFRIEAEATPEQRGKLWTTTYLLLGLRYAPDLTAQLLKGVRQLKESSTYQAILAEGRAEGRAEEARAIVLRIGAKRFGPPDPATRAALGAITSTERLDHLVDRLLEVENWSELLAQ